jgi:hypothetical protein
LKFAGQWVYPSYQSVASLMILLAAVVQAFQLDLIYPIQRAGKEVNNHPGSCQPNKWKKS